MIDMAMMTMRIGTIHTEDVIEEEDGVTTTRLITRTRTHTSLSIRSIHHVDDAIIKP
jgi:hypothetical protein